MLLKGKDVSAGLGALTLFTLSRRAVGSVQTQLIPSGSLSQFFNIMGPADFATLTPKSANTSSAILLYSP